ncbi:hypothetical protein BKA64DRAFT_659649 [Cadophora sp. MPI-SDFR-AT-0126]|nr:hypothetical protein BKA64DRAFT_659649 [Leotiomycetes sp. MPI-SDFR-AT-0126]
MMRSPFSKSKKSLVKETVVSSPGSTSPSSQEGSEKISVTSESPSVTQHTQAPLSQETLSSTQREEIRLLFHNQQAPNCHSCGEACTRLVTRVSNRNGNGGRPYYKCIRCDKFSCFDDSRGEDENNPVCDCGKASRRQLSSREKGRRIFYVCKTGSCQFFQFHKRQDGSNWSVGEDLAEALAELRVV